MEDAVLEGAILGTFFGGFAVLAIIYYILLVIADWKIFTKAGVAGWKSLIPVYNVFVSFKLAGVSTAYFIALIIAGIISGCVGESETIVATILSLVAGIAVLVVNVVYANKLAKSFGKGTGFAVGLFFLPNIFQLILGFGSSEYQGPVE